MKKQIQTIALVVFSGIIGACEKELDRIQPSQSISTEVALSTSENIKNILIGAYSEAGESTLYGGYLHLMTELLAITDQASWVGTFAQPRQAFTKSLLVDNSFVRDIWLKAYATINQANLVIDHIDIVEPEGQTLALGEAKFIRAMAYFDLVRNFGLPYEAGQQNSQLGVPLSLTGIVDYSGDLNIARNSVEEVYAQIILDLNDAYNSLPPNNGVFADRYAAQALLATVYLQQGNYAMARDAANDVIENSGHTLAASYGLAFNNDVNSTEDLFAFQVTTQDGSNNLVIHYAAESDGGRGGDIIIEDAYLDLFDDVDDDRGNFVYINPANGKQLTLKYTNQYGNIPMIRLAEMYLVRAEANFRENSAIGDTPLNDINALRDRANASLLGAVDLDVILLERQLELAFEGKLLNDLKRTQRPVGARPYNDNGLVFPIPQRELDANPLLEPNPGYGI